VVVIVGVLLLLALPAAIALAAFLDRERDVRKELRAAVPWLGLVLWAGALGYLWAAWWFRETDDFWRSELNGELDGVAGPRVGA
jgi:hypothetical protein